MSTHPPPAPSPARTVSRAGPAPRLAIGSLVCGILAVALLTHPFAEIAIVLGVLARRRLPVHPPRPGGATARWGIALGALALVLFVLVPVAGIGTGDPQ